MGISRRLSLAVVLTCGLVLGASFPGAAPQFGEWQPAVKLGDAINSVATYGACISRGGLSLFVTRGSGANADIYVAERPSVAEEWGEAVPLGAPVNLAGSEDMIPFLSRDEHWLFFTSNRSGSQGRDQWMAYRPNVHDNFGWQPAVNLGSDVNSSAAETSGSFFENEGGTPFLYFASNRLMPSPPGGSAPPPGNDIYVSPLLPDGTFGAAVRDDALSTNLGGVKDYEGRPMIRFDGREIIFLSDRDGGAGGYDLYAATRETVEAPWSEPVRLTTLNTAGNEMHPYLSPDGETLFFTRSVSGILSIYMTTRERPGMGHQK